MDSNNKAYIMVAETQADLRWLYERWLKDSGFIVRTVSDGPWLLSLVPPSPPDLIIIDMNLTGIDALETCARLKQNEDCRHIPILMVGHQGDALERRQVETSCADGYILKPFSRTELCMLVEQLLQVIPSPRYATAAI